MTMDYAQYAKLDSITRQLFEQPNAETAADSTEAREWLSNEISKQMSDKRTLAENASRNFGDWDKDKNGALSLIELNTVFLSSNASLPIAQRPEFWRITIILPLTYISLN